MSEKIFFNNGYSMVNGLRMYYEIYGEGKPLVLIHGGGSTIQTSFAKIIPLLSQKRKIIAMDLQAHGRTDDRNTPLSFQQDADDVAMLLENLQIAKADILGFSNGGQTLIEIALRHPDKINKLVICSSFYNRSAAAPQFWEGFEGRVQFSNMPQVYKDAFLKVNNNQEALLNMFNKDVWRMRMFRGWSDEQIQSIKAPTLIINGNKDVGSTEHTVQLYHLIPDSQLVILPGGHGAYMDEISVYDPKSRSVEYFIPILEEFLDYK